jgi:hypothetical protein
VLEPTDEAEAAAPEEPDAPPPDEPAGPGEPRRHTTPEPGTAAERAAARRARLREQGKGES